MRVLWIISGCIFIILGCSRNNDNTNSQQFSNTIPVDTLDKWEDYASSSDNGLWENDDSRRVIVTRVESYGGEEDLDPPFFKSDFISLYGDTIYISDGSQEALIAMDSSGEVLWKRGQPGEGPGDFLMIGSTSRSGNTIAVCNNSIARLDFFTAEGDYRNSINISGPQNVIMLTDSTGIAASKSQPGGNVHLFSAEGGIETSIGANRWVMFPNNFPRRDLFIACHHMGSVACVSQFEDNLYIYDLESGETINSGTRELPAEPTGGDLQTYYTLYATIFTGPDSMINVPIPDFMDNGQFLGSGGRHHAPVTVVDRYNWDGDYLDSYVLPDSVLNVIAYSEELGFIAAQRGTGKIFRYTLER